MAVEMSDARTALQDEKVSARIGLLAPPSNVVMEVDFYRSLPTDVTVHTSHIYRSRTTVSVDAMTETAQNAVETARSLVQTACDVVMYGHAASSYTIGVQGDAQLERVIAAAAGAPALTVATAIVRCLKSLGMPRVAFVAPYPKGIIDSGAAFLTDSGLDIRVASGLGIDRVSDLREVSLETVYELGLRVASQTQVDALYICGTGVHTRGVVGPLERSLKKPVITANLAALWSCLDRIGQSQHFRFGDSRLLAWQKERAP